MAALPMLVLVTLRHLLTRPPCSTLLQLAPTAPSIITGFSISFVICIIPCMFVPRCKRTFTEALRLNLCGFVLRCKPTTPFSRLAEITSRTRVLRCLCTTLRASCLCLHGRVLRYRSALYHRVLRCSCGCIQVLRCLGTSYSKDILEASRLMYVLVHRCQRTLFCRALRCCLAVCHCVLRCQDIKCDRVLRCRHTLCAQLSAACAILKNIPRSLCRYLFRAVIGGFQIWLWSLRRPLSASSLILEMGMAVVVEFIYIPVLAIRLLLRCLASPLNLLRCAVLLGLAASGPIAGALLSAVPDEFIYQIIHLLVASPDLAVGIVHRLVCGLLWVLAPGLLRYKPIQVPSAVLWFVVVVCSSEMRSTRRVLTAHLRQGATAAISACASALSSGVAALLVWGRTYSTLIDYVQYHTDVDSIELHFQYMLNADAYYNGSVPTSALLNVGAGMVAFLIDSGASQHVVSDASLLANSQPASRKFATANGDVTSKRKGSLQLECNGKSFNADDVYHLPNCGSNVLSLGQLIADGYTVDFKNSLMWKDAYDTLQLEHRNNLWYLVSCSPAHPADQNFRISHDPPAGQAAEAAIGGAAQNCSCQHCRMPFNISESSLQFNSTKSKSPRVYHGVGPHIFRRGKLSSGQVKRKIDEINAERVIALQRVSDDKVRKLTPIELAHARFGHFNDNYIAELERQGIDTGLDLRHAHKGKFHCPTCARAKAVRPPFTHVVTQDRASAPGDLVHTDIFGKVRVASKEGYIYAIHFTDHYTRFTKVYFMKNKSEALSKFKEYVAYCEQHNIKVKKIQTDNALEYTSKDFKSFCSVKHIQLRHSGPYMHESNGTAERIWRTITDSAITMLLTAMLPLPFWDKAFAHATYLRNRLPHRSINMDTPYERWFQSKPVLNNVRVFGCIAYKYIDQSARRKLEPTATQCLYMGNSEDSNTYILWDQMKQMFTSSGMADFHEEFDAQGRLEQRTLDERKEPTSPSRYTEQLDNSGPAPDEHQPGERSNLEPLPPDQERPGDQPNAQQDGSASSPPDEGDQGLPRPPKTVSKAQFIDPVAAVLNFNVVKCNDDSRDAVVQVKYVKRSRPPQWVRLSSLLRSLSPQERDHGTNPNRSRSYYRMFSSFLNKQTVPQQIAPLYARVKSRFPEDDGSTRVYEGIVTSTDYNREDGNHFFVVFTDGGCMWTRADELEDDSQHIDGMRAQLNVLAYSNILQRIGRLTTDWMFSPAEFAKLNDQYHHTVDACCNPNGDNKHLPKYWSRALTQNWAGENVWCNPPFHQVELFILKFLEGFAKEPFNTSATFIVPFWPQASWWPLLLRNFHVVKLYKRGERLFTAPDPNDPGSRKDYGPTRWDVVVLRSLPPVFIAPELSSADDEGGESTSSHAASAGGNGEQGGVLPKVTLITSKAKDKILTSCSETYETLLNLGLHDFTENFRLFLTIDGSGNKIPRTVQEAKSLPDAEKWAECWESELNSLLENDVGVLVPQAEVPKGQKVLKSRAVFKIKYKNGTIDKYKARFVACGYDQREGIDYEQITSAVAGLQTIRMLVSMACSLNLTIYHLDFETAFLQSDLDKEIYCSLPEGASQYDERGRLLCMKLKKSLYGLKQSPRLWSKKLEKWLKDYGFEQCTHYEDCLWYYKSKDESTFCILCTYVDDMPFFSNSQQFIDEFVEQLKKDFRVGELEPINQILQIQVRETQNKDGVHLSQTHYITDLAKRFELISEDGKLIASKIVGQANTPLPPTFKISSQGCPTTDEGKKEMAKYPYSQLVGCLLWISRGTRPDVAHAVAVLSQYSSNPGHRHWTALLGVLAYLYKTRHHGLHYLHSPKESNKLTAYSDTDFATDEDDRKSHGGMLAMLNGGPIGWFSKKLPGYVSLSASEAEYRNLSEVGKSSLYSQENARVRWISSGMC